MQGLQQGPGGGQDDLIDAKLSPGEFVWSAQDVADAGDGDTNAGAQRLEQVRHQIRSRAGRKNVGKIAPKQPPLSAHMRKAGVSI